MKYKECVDKINNSPCKVAIALAGGGQSFLYHFMKYSGASKTIADVRIPYGKEAFESFCGKPVDHFVSEETARLLATKSYESCLDQIEPKYAIGLGLTCSLATDGEREGRIHKIFLAIHCFEYTKVIHIELIQGLTREQEEEFCCYRIFKMLIADQRLANTINVDFDICDYILIDTVNYTYRDWFTTEISDNIDHLVIVPGSYNPFHEGHKEMIITAEQILGVAPYVELSTLNADKGVLDYIEVEHRLSNIPFNKILTTSSTFLDKARLFYKPGRKIDFVIGVDTWNRILNPKYAGSTKELYTEFTKMNVRFLVFQREGYPRRMDLMLDRLLIKDERSLNFNVPISSTQLRETL